MHNITILILSGGENIKNIIEEGCLRREAYYFLDTNSIAQSLTIPSSHSFIFIDLRWKTPVRVRFRTTLKSLRAQRLEQWDMKVKTQDFRLNTSIEKVCLDKQALNWWISPYEIVTVAASMYVKSTRNKTTRTDTDIS